MRVNQVSGQPLLRSRSTLLLLVLSVLLIAAIIAGFILTAAANSGPKGAGTPVASTDVLAGNQSAWATSPTFFFDASGRYHIVNKSAQTLATALYESVQLTNFHLTVTTTHIKGPVDGGDFYGVVLRSTQDQSHYYLFEICPFTDQYEFERFDGSWHNLGNGAVLFDPYGCGSK